MADLVLGVAKSLVEGTLSRAQSAIEEESQLRKSTRRNLVFITGEFQMMQSYLSNTSGDNVKKNGVVSTWVAQLRDLTYDVEDGIEFVIHLDPKHDWWLRMIPSWLCIAPPRPLDEAVDIIEHLTTRVQDVRQRIAHYSLVSNDSATKPTAEEKQQQVTSQVRDEDLPALTNLITNKTLDLQVISLWLPGNGLGAAKTTIRRAYNHSKSWRRSFPARVWVKVKQTGFNTDEFLETLLKELKDGTMKGAAKADVHYIQRMLQSDRFLVVLEDLFTKSKTDDIIVWDTLQKYVTYLHSWNNNKGSRIIVITSRYEIATLCTGTESPYVQRLWADFSLCVFSKEFSKEGSLIGRKSAMDKLTGCVTEARSMNASQVISVWGMAGTGKSALVRSVCHEWLHLKKKETTEDQVIDKFAWIDVKHPFDLCAVCNSLFIQLSLRSPKANEDIEKECHSILELQYCLVVIDNLQSKEDWDAIEDRLLFGPSKTTIIIITNDESIALHCAQRQELVFNVRALEAWAAFDLFRTKVSRDPCFGKYDVKNNQGYQSLVSMCGGLPKLLVAVSEYLAQDPNGGSKEGEGAQDPNSWRKKGEELRDNFFVYMERRPEFISLRDMFSSIHHYFCSCPDYLKPCMFYLSVFNQEQTIRRRRLVMRWIAEGYCKDKPDETAEDSAEKIFAKIVELSMIQLPQEERIVTGMRSVRCQISAFFHQYIARRRKEENVTFALEVFFLEGRCCPSTGRTGRHLVIKKEWKRDKIVFEAMDLSRLRSLTVYGEWRSFFISESMKVLRVLDLEDATGVENKDLKSMLKLLPRLKFLSLRGCIKISYLPGSVGDLRQLQTLDVRDTSVVAMPASITKLRELQYLRAGNTRSESAPGTVAFNLSPFQRCLHLVGVNVKVGVGELTSLHTLGVVNVGGERGEDILNELKNLTQLRKIGASGVCRKNGKKFFSDISDHSHLKSLSVWFKETIQESTWSGSNHPQELESLKLYGPVERLPTTWINQLKHIRKIVLEFLDKLPAEDIKTLAELKYLCILRLVVKPNQHDILEFRVMSSSGVEVDCFGNLNVLEIFSRSGLRLSIGGQAMVNLQKLKVQSCCTGSQLQIDGLKHLVQLKEIDITCSQSQAEALKTHLEDQITARKPVFKQEKVKALARHQSKDQNIVASKQEVIIYLFIHDEVDGRNDQAVLDVLPVADREARSPPEPDPLQYCRGPGSLPAPCHGDGADVPRSSWGRSSMQVGRWL